MAAREGGAVTADANSKKRLKYSNLNRSLLFAHVAIEILGVLSPKVKALFVSELA